MFLCCWCCGCCCFKAKGEAGLCGLISFIVSVALNAGVLIGASVGLGYSGKFVSYFNGSSCSLISFFDHALDGDESETLPRWGGTNNIQTAFQSTSNSLTSIGSKYNSVYDTSTRYVWIKNQFANANPPDSVSNAISALKAEADSKFFSLSYKPSFYSEFTSQSNTDTILGAINNDYKEYCFEPFVGINNLKNPLNEICQSNTISSTLNSSGGSFSSIGSVMDKASNTIADNFVNLQSKISDFILLGFRVIFGFYIGVSIGSAGLLVGYAFFEIKILKILNHLFWNLSLIFIFLAMLIGGILGIVGEIGSQVSPVINFIFSPDYMNSPDSILGGDDKTGGFINTCLNGNGDLSGEMNANTTDTQKLNEVYQLSQNIKQLDEKMSSISQSPAIEKAYSKIQNYYDNFGSLTATDGKTFQEIMQYTKDHCGSSFAPDIGLSSCPGSSGSCPIYCDLLAHSKTFITTLLSTTSNQLSELKSEMNGAITEIKAQTTATRELTTSLTDALGPILGESGGFFDIFNCGFIKYDIIDFCDQFSNIFSSTSKSIAISCAITSLFSFVSIFFTVSTMSRFTKFKTKPQAGEPTKIELASKSEIISKAGNILKVAPSTERVQLIK